MPPFSCFKCTHQDPIPFVRRFSYEEIKSATGGFTSIISQRSDGAVYKGQFQDGLVAAVLRDVKALNDLKDAFYTEVQLLMRLHHRNIVALRGFSTGHKRFLVFEHMENGSLKDQLSDPLKSPLAWTTRLQIAIGVAAALEYLLFFVEPPRYQFSISASSVLLDENFVPKLSDVGVSSSETVESPDASLSRVRLDQDDRKLIFQLGVLILELITGQFSEKDGTNLVKWVQEPGINNSMERMVDPDIGNRCDRGELKTLLNVAKYCTRTRKGKMTFSIQHILQYLQKKVDPSVQHV